MSDSKGIGGHHQAHKGKTDEWLTPPHVLTALGPFDLDPCSPVNRPWPTAAAHYTAEDDGLSKTWTGRVFLNPPYGPFDLDPCSPVNRPWPTAAAHYTAEDDGLSKTWTGRVFLNPPYGPETGKWLRKLAEHGDGIALIFARTETEMFFAWGWDRADAMLFLKGRLTFHTVDGKKGRANAGGPSVLIAYGHHNAETLRTCGLPGKFVRL